MIKTLWCHVCQRGSSRSDSLLNHIQNLLWGSFRFWRLWSQWRSPRCDLQPREFLLWDASSLKAWPNRAPPTQLGVAHHPSAGHIAHTNLEMTGSFILKAGERTGPDAALFCLPLRLKKNTTHSSVSKCLYDDGRWCFCKDKTEFLFLLSTFKGEMMSLGLFYEISWGTRVDVSFCDDVCGSAQTSWEPWDLFLESVLASSQDCVKCLIWNFDV